MPAGDRHLSRGKPELLERPPQPAQSMLLHLHHGHALRIVAVALRALEMRMELEIIDVVFAVPGGETDHGLARAGDPEDRQRDVALVRRQHLDPPIVGAQHHSVVDPHAHPVGECRILIGVHGLDPQVGIEPPEQIQHRLDATGGGILLLIEIGKIDGLPQPAHNLARFKRGREGLFARDVELRIVAIERHVGENGDGSRAADDGAVGEPAPEAGRRNRQPQPGRKQHRERDDHPGEPEDGGKIAKRFRVHHRSASFRVVRNKASMEMLTKYPTSERNTEPPTVGLKWPISDRLMTKRSKGRGNR